MANTEKTTTKPEVKTKPETKSNKPNRSGNNKIAISLSLLAILVALGGIYVVSKDWQAMQSDTATLQNQSQQLSNTLAQTQQTIASQQQALTAAQKSIVQLEEKMGRNSNDWVLAEAKYLIHLADYNLEFGHHSNTAIALLQAANQRIASLDDPRFLKLRAALTNDITNLQQLPNIDITGILLKIDSVSAAVAKLPLIDKTQTSQQGVQTTNSQKSQQAADSLPLWKRGLDDSLATLKTLVVIRHHQQNIEPLISPKQQSYLMENIQLQLANAQWALLNQQPEIYVRSLKQASTWVKKYYVTSSTATKNVLGTLALLEKKQIAQKPPKLNQSLTAIKNAMQKKPTQQKAIVPNNKTKKPPEMEV